jgi:hypothetical protein
MTRRLRIAIVAAAFGLALGGCPAPDITPQASSALEELVDAARDSAEGGDPDLAAEHLDRLREEIRRFRDEGDVSDERAEEILLAADQVEALLALLEEPEPEPEPDEPRGKGKDKDGRGGGKGK